MAKFWRPFCMAAAFLSCVYGAYTAADVIPLELGGSDITDILNVLSTARRNVVPPARNMQVLVWKDELAKAAQSLTLKCVMKFNPDESSKKKIEDNWVFYVASKPNYTTIMNNSWIRNGALLYNYEKNTCAVGAACNYYTQVIWAKTTAVGCGATRCPIISGFLTPNSVIFRCVYTVEGNIPGQHPYESGIPCSQCNAGQICYNKLCGKPQCDQEVIIGGQKTTVAMVKTNVTTCFTCLEPNSVSARTPVIFSINGINMITKNANVNQVLHQLFVTNLTALSMLMDGQNNKIECINGIYTLFSRTVITLNPVLPSVTISIPEFYVEGSAIRIPCINRNVRPFRGRSYWVDPMNMTVGDGGYLIFKNISRSQAGLYTCRVFLEDHAIMVKFPNRSITVVVHYSPNVTTTNRSLETFSQGDTLILMCSFVGLPLPSLKWMQKGLPLSNNNDSITITTTSGLSNGNSTLQWVKVPFHAAGMFTCTATNNLGSDKEMITLFRI